MLDNDLAILYDVPVKSLNLAVKRNMDRFPDDFMFQLTREEYDSIRFQVETLDIEDPLRFQSETLKAGRGQHRKYLPYGFTEQGVAMLSGILHSTKAIKMNIAIMRVFVEIRRLALQRNDLTAQLKDIQQRLGDHDGQISAIYDAIENLLDEKVAKKKWDERERIGFRK